MVHISNLVRGRQVSNARDVVDRGQSVWVKVREGLVSLATLDTALLLAYLI